MSPNADSRMNAAAGFHDYIDQARATIDQALDRCLPQPPDSPPVLCEAMRYSVMAGGKRLDVGRAVDEALEQIKDEPVLPYLMEKISFIPPLSQGIIWSTLCTVVQKFSDMLDTLRLRADKPDFWKAIGV